MRHDTRTQDGVRLDAPSASGVGPGDPAMVEAFLHDMRLRMLPRSATPGRRDALRHLLLLLGLAPVSARVQASGPRGWSTPPEVVYPAAPPDNATTVSIATAAPGNSVAVWYDVGGSGSLQAATLAAGAENSAGQPEWVVIDPVAAANVQASFNPTDNVVGMDAQGDALAVWTDGINVYAARLLAGQATWSAATIVNTPVINELVANPDIAVAANGNAVVIWTSSVHPYDVTVLANSYDAQLGLWQGQTNVLPGAVEFDVIANPVAVDASGNAVATLFFTSNNVQASAFDFSANTWTPIPSILTSPGAQAVTVDAAGNATVVALLLDASVVAATLPKGNTLFVNPTTLSTTASLDASFPRVAVDQAGNALAVWADVAGGLASAHYLFATGTWSALPTLALANGPPNNISLFVGPGGNAVAAWTVFSGANSFVQAAMLPAGSTVWSAPADLSPHTAFDQNAQVVLTARGDALAMWENDINGGTGTIDSSIFLTAFAAAPAAIPATGRMGLTALSLLIAGSTFFLFRRLVGRTPAPGSRDSEPGDQPIKVTPVVPPNP
jgi:hypothetical protein